MSNILLDLICRTPRDLIVRNDPNVADFSRKSIPILY